MPEEDKEPTDDPPRPPPKPVKQSSKHVRVGPVELEDPTVVEWDPEERFHRYAEELATGRYKTVYRAYDTENGIDVAWCKVRTAEGDPSPNDALTQIYKEMKKGLTLDHPSIVRCFACWFDRNKGCINLITELFTSGTLRAYRQAYSNVDLNVYRKYVRQLLQGLEYLHAQTPPIVHADLKLDKIYVNGFNAEVKIGDLGLTTLITKHYDSSKPPVVDSPKEDMLALGLCVYELLTGIPPDRTNAPSSFRENLPLSKIMDKDARDFIIQCLDTDNPLTAHALLEHQFLKSQTTEFKVKNGGEWDLKRVESRNQSIETKLRGEDWNFAFQVCSVYMAACVLRFSA